MFFLLSLNVYRSPVDHKYCTLEQALEVLFLSKGWGPRETLDLYLDDSTEGIYFYYNAVLRQIKKK